MARRTLGETFDSSPNALNLLRLAMAVEVLVWHSYGLTHAGAVIPRKVALFAGDVGVDTFFAITGVLITRAWLRRPDLAAFAAARGRRLLPGLAVCLVVTAFAVGPVAALLAGDPVPGLATSAGYVAHNADVWVGQY